MATVESSLRPSDLIPNPRSSSLYVPQIPRSVPILDTTSYSPFPTFPGNARTSDPYGLNTFLLAPNDTMWSYVDPIPDHSGSGSEGEEEVLSRPQSISRPPKIVRKQKSLGLLRSSPLSQPPMTGGQAPVEKTLVRKRSLSLGNALQHIRHAEVKEVPPSSPVPVRADKETVQPKEEEKKRGIKGAFVLTRKGRKSEPLANTTPVSAVPTLSFTDEDLVTYPVPPFTTRSSSQSTISSSASSSSSSDDIRTPAEGLAPEGEVLMEPKSIANALEKGKKKSRMWAWLGGRRKSDGLGVLSRDSSAKNSPAASTTDLLAAPEPEPQTRKLSPVQLPSQIMVEHTYLTNQLRSSSMRKLSQLKAPSPHPFTLALVRQNRKLPDEIALSIQHGRRVFPKSVNPFTGLGDLSPAQGGLRLGLAVRDVMIKLDRGEQPQGTIMPRRSPKKSIVSRPRGVLDFINRPAFGQRNLLFFPDGFCTQIAGRHARDFEFSPYILGMGEVDESSEWSSRGSRESLRKDMHDEDEDASAALRALERGSSLSPPLVASRSSPVSPSPSLPPVNGGHVRSSFVRAPQPIFRKAYDSDEDDDREVLSVTRRRSQILRSSSASPRPPLLPPHVRAPSFSKRALSADELQREKDAALFSVQQAREKREANRRGEGERRAEAERLQKIGANRLSRGVSMMDIKSPSVQRVTHKRMSSTGRIELHGGQPRNPSPFSSRAVPTHETQRNRQSIMSSSSSSTHASHNQSHSNRRPESHRSQSGTSDGKPRPPTQYHSFYEQRSGVASSPNLGGRSVTAPRMAQPIHNQHQPQNQQAHVQGWTPTPGYTGMESMMQMPHGGSRGSMYGLGVQYPGLGMGMSMGGNGKGPSRMA